MEKKRIGVRGSTLSLLHVTILFTIAFPQLVVAGDAFPAPEGIIAWWTFDETTGTNAEDIIGGNDGTHINGPTPVPGKVGHALRFDGSNDYVRVPDSDLWHFGSSDFTIEFWASFVPGSPGSIGRPGDVFIGNDQGGGERPKWFFAWGASRLNFHVNNYGSNPKFFLPQVVFYPKRFYVSFLMFCMPKTTLSRGVAVVL